MTAMIERVARVLHGQDKDAPCGADAFPSAVSGYPPDRPAWSLYEDEAREIIASMREPTAEITAAFFDAKNRTYNGDRWVCRDSEFRGIYAAMIDAALQEPTK